MSILNQPFTLKSSLFVGDCTPSMQLSLRIVIATVFIGFTAVQGAVLERRLICICPGKITNGPCDFGVDPPSCETIG
ncbi:hypothetical protein SISNIDRAFT_489755 [Sistotremastrum niveocremeum HHB9708]|uniref:Uncharacterized protein n=2 Tax=Sistotremastraceae TaxID=3402574 RepID=A0A164PP37_9AGAM|nr:hypothetical protein SISNIDRAFT_489755 [Sistotremastrum niveocremeum HHB9708]KZT41983.1 hypothetical protein SISSUDRAFT_1059079 [Sistotremastrum suecicum HHB10207 ss-3]